MESKLGPILLAAEKLEKGEYASAYRLLLELNLEGNLGNLSDTEFHHVRMMTLNLLDIAARELNW